MSEEILKKVKHFVAAGIGDTKRLRDILDTIKRGEPLVLSDFRYIEELTVSESEQQDKTTSSPVIPKPIDMDESLSLLRIRLAEGSITIEEFRELKKAITED